MRYVYGLLLMLQYNVLNFIKALSITFMPFTFAFNAINRYILDFTSYRTAVYL